MLHQQNKQTDDNLAKYFLSALRLGAISKAQDYSDLKGTRAEWEVLEVVFVSRNSMQKLPETAPSQDFWQLVAVFEAVPC